MTSTVWALGDYERVARDLVAPFGPELVAACGIGPGQRVLDVACGTGNVALEAAAAGAEVTGCDLTPELLAAALRKARDRCLTVRWLPADAEALPFADAEFDVVTSSIGAMFAPDHAATAGELLRVCRPGGVIGLINWPPHSWSGAFFQVLAPFAPAPVGPAPTLWGTERHVCELFGNAATVFDVAPGTLVVDHFESPDDLVRYYRANFGPVVAAYAGLAGDSGRREALDRALADFARRSNRGTNGGPALYHLDYLRVVARRC
jgi:ubiquinone/menaquinone biosynthesis C-methylase UbiE